MSNKEHHNSGNSPEREYGQVIADCVALLDCKPACVLSRPDVRVVLLTIGRADGAVEQIAFSEGEGSNLIDQLASILRRQVPRAAAETAESGASRAGGCRPTRRQHFTSTAIRKIESSLDEQAADRQLAALRQIEPHLAEYLVRRTKSLSATVSRTCNSLVTGKAIGEKMLRVVLTAVNVAITRRP